MMPRGGNGVISVYGVNPQNPLIPTATNEVGGGDPIQNLFAGLMAYNADGSVVNEVAESIEPDDSQKTWTVKLKDWKFTDGYAGHVRVVRPCMELWRRCDEQAPEHLLLLPDRGHRRRGQPSEGREGDVRAQDRRRQDVHDHAEVAGVRLPAAPRLLRVLPDARRRIRRGRKVHQGVRRAAHRQRPVHAEQDRLGTQQADLHGAEPGLHGLTQAGERWSDVHVLQLDRRGFQRRAGRQPRRPRRGAAERPADVSRKTTRSRRTTSPARTSRRITIPERLPHFKRRRGQPAPAGHLDGDQPPGDLREDLLRCPYSGEGLHVPGAGRLDRERPGQRGARTSTTRRPSSCGPTPTRSTSGTASSRSPTTPTVPATRSTPRR